MTAAVEISDLHKQYGSRVALRGIDVRVDPGTVVGFVGPNGAGKTTTMRILVDVLRPTSGQVRVLGEDPRTGGARLRSRIGYLPGELRLDGRHDVASLLDHYVEISHTASVSRHDARAAWRTLAERLGVDPTRRVRGLSKGNKQKVGLVQAFVHRPDLLVLDEPTSGLDPLVQAEFLTMVREVRDEGRTVFLSSHVLSEIEQAADSVVVLREGRVVLTSAVEAVRASLGQRVHLTLAGHVAAAPFVGLDGVRSATATHDGADTRLTLDLDGTPDAALRLATTHTVLAVDAERPDLESAVMSFYTQES
ncbi:ABC transporter ATP-binding protein [Mobilicoccus pelagius]|uniref:Putative ABC transporter ATP-binding protein n=1 Tax=Mobilicoccus pelagius NBRC 104925 TaxID=1089455 RepID=H5UQL0_9MICO|nr:ABC transporter ATP-binding protein [Mobilicoccus pelagius]GAB48018.1 putative ABC transporter ATP-binding protein [Mobilicoccus pelagius NBRC 104925]